MRMRTMFSSIKKADFIEFYVSILLFIGLPLVGYVYFDWRAALAIFVLTQILIGILVLRTTPIEQVIDEKEEVE